MITVDGPTITDLINLLVAVGAFAAMVGGLLWKARKWQRDDVSGIVKHEVASIKAEQLQLLNEQKQLWAGQQELASKFDRLNASFAGHESRLSFLEGKEAARAEFRAGPPVELTEGET